MGEHGLGPGRRGRGGAGGRGVMLVASRRGAAAREQGCQRQHQLDTGQRSALEFHFSSKQAFHWTE